MQETVRLFPKYTPAYNALGVLLYQLHRYKEAVAALNRGLKIEPNQPTMRYNLGVVQLTNKNKPAAIEQYSFLKASDDSLARQLYQIIYADKLIFAGNK